MCNVSDVDQRFYPSGAWVRASSEYPSYSSPSISLTGINRRLTRSRAVLAPTIEYASIFCLSLYEKFVCRHYTIEVINFEVFNLDPFLVLGSSSMKPVLFTDIASIHVSESFVRKKLNCWTMMRHESDAM